MFSMGMPELLLILVVALVVVGPKKLPDLAKSLGKGMRQFRQATDEIKGEFADNDSVKDVMEIKKSFRETMDSINPQGLLDVDPLVEPKKPREDLEGRKELFAEIEKEQADALAAQKSADPTAAGQGAGPDELVPTPDSEPLAEPGQPEPTAPPKPVSDTGKND